MIGRPERLPKRDEWLSPFSSRTELLAGGTPTWWIEERARLLEHELAIHPPA